MHVHVYIHVPTCLSLSLSLSLLSQCAVGSSVSGRQHSGTVEQLLTTLVTSPHSHSPTPTHVGRHGAGDGGRWERSRHRTHSILNQERHVFWQGGNTGIHVHCTCMYACTSHVQCMYMYIHCTCVCMPSELLLPLPNCFISPPPPPSLTHSTQRRMVHRNIRSTWSLLEAVRRWKNLNSIPRLSLSTISTAIFPACDCTYPASAS